MESLKFMEAAAVEAARKYPQSFVYAILDYVCVQGAESGKSGAEISRDMQKTIHGIMEEFEQREAAIERAGKYIKIEDDPQELERVYYTEWTGGEA